MKTLPAVLSGLVVWLLVAASTSSRANQVASCTIQSADTINWQTIGTAEFAFRLPMDFHDASGISIDSIVHTWRDSLGRTATSDWGPYSNGLTGPPFEGFTVCSEQIGGQLARVVYGVDAQGKFMVGAAWRSVGPLTLIVRGTTEADLPMLLAIVRSTTFKR